VEELVNEIISMLKSGKSFSEIEYKFRHEDADLVGEAMVEAEARMAGLGDNTPINW